MRPIDILAASELIAKAQPRAWSLIESLAASGKLPPALVFTGPEGAGKELMAVRLAAMLECEAPPAPPSRPPCPSVAPCRACSRVRTLEHPDFHPIYPVPHGEMEDGMPVVVASRREDFFASGEFEKARSIGIDLVRHVIEAFSKQPFEGRRTVAVFFEAHLATTEAQNALLKLLEEPPPAAVIVLVTEFPDRLLPTIQSRCYEVRFDPLEADAIAGFLSAFYSVEGGEARRLGALARGNLRRGIHLLDERFLALWKDAAGVVKLVVGGKAPELLGEAEGISSRYTREETEELLEETAGLFGLVLRHRDGRIEVAEREALEAALGAPALAAAARRDLVADIKRIIISIGNLRRNADVELTLSQLLLDLAGAWY